MSDPKLTSRSFSCYQLNQLGIKATSESTFDLNTRWTVKYIYAGYQIIYFTFSRQVILFYYVIKVRNCECDHSFLLS